MQQIERGVGDGVLQQRLMSEQDECDQETADQLRDRVRRYTRGAHG
jgi:hypothetical protein